jgi:ATP-dependent Clp protease ATP-binding subunit ClpA
VFDAFSVRARQIVFAARFKAGQRGATSIEVADLLLGLVLEDQGMLGEFLFPTLHDPSSLPVNETPSHIRVFTEEIAKTLISEIEASYATARPIGLATEIPVSPELDSLCRNAKKIQVRFHHAQVEPLHLLAGLLEDASSRCGQLLQANGITQKQVMLRLGDTAEGN